MENIIIAENMIHLSPPSAILSFGRYTMFVRYIRSTFPPHRHFTVQLLISILVEPNWL